MSAAARAWCSDARRDDAGTVEDLAKRDAPIRARLVDHAWRRQRRRDIRSAANDGCPPDDGGNGVRTVDPVLERQDDRRLTDQRAEQRQRRVVVVSLHREKYEVHVADDDGVLPGSRADLPVAQRAPHPHPLRPDRVQVHAPRDEHHVMAGSRQQRSVVAADSA